MLLPHSGLGLPVSGSQGIPPRHASMISCHASPVALLLHTHTHTHTHTYTHTHAHTHRGTHTCVCVCVCVCVIQHGSDTGAPAIETVCRAQQSVHDPET